jgi:hypothetical protein
VGFERTKASNGDVEQQSFLAGAISHGGIGGDDVPLALVIPAAGNIFEIDADAALATPTKAGALALSGRTARMAYSVITSGVVGAPKANPLLDVSDAEGSAGGALQAQLLVVGLGAKGDAMDFTATNVTFQVMVSALEMGQQGDPTIFGANVE